MAVKMAVSSWHTLGMTAKRRERYGEGSVHRRPNGTWCGQIELGLDANGKRLRRTVYAKTETALRKKMKAERRVLDETGSLPTADAQLARWLDDWLERVAAKRVKPATLRSYRTAVEHHIKPSIGKVRLSRLSAAHIRKMHADITGRTSKRGKQTLSTTTAHNAHRVLAAALADAVLEGRVGRNIASIVPAPSKAESDRLGLTATSAVALLTAAPDSRWLAALLLGLRQGERLGLRWSHVDLDAGIADLAWSLTHVSYAHGCGDTCGLTPRRCPKRHLPIPAGMRHEPLEGNLVLMAPKTKGSRRIVPIPDPLLQALRVQHDITSGRRFDLVWCEEDGSPIEPKQDWQDWQAALEKANLPKVTLHEARHTCASLLLELGVDVKVIGSILGHSQVTTTRGYQHASVELSRAALAGLARRLALPAAAATA